MLKGLAHVCYIVKDLSAAEAFYVDALGLRHAFDFINDAGERFGVYLHAGGRCFVELFTGSPGPAAGSYQHLCLEVTGLTDFVAELRGKGIEASDPYLGSDQSWQSWITDPDGNRIELHEYTLSSQQVPWVEG
jgi:glyoxylase I family protein